MIKISCKFNFGHIYLFENYLPMASAIILQACDCVHYSTDLKTVAWTICYWRYIAISSAS